MIYSVGRGSEKAGFRVKQFARVCTTPHCKSKKESFRNLRLDQILQQTKYMREDKRELTLLSVRERQTEKGELSYEQYICMREYGKANIEASTSDTSHATPVTDFVSL